MGAVTEPSLEQHRILVVDDEEYLTDLLSTSLRFQGFEVAIADNGFGALATAGSFEPDLILLDVMMPDIDGMEVCRRLRSAGNQVPVIFLTARDTKADLLSGFTVGGDDYIAKPFRLFGTPMLRWTRQRMSLPEATARSIFRQQNGDCCATCS